MKKTLQELTHRIDGQTNKGHQARFYCKKTGKLLFVHSEPTPFDTTKQSAKDYMDFKRRASLDAALTLGVDVYQSTPHNYELQAKIEAHEENQREYNERIYERQLALEIRNQHEMDKQWENHLDSLIGA